ncbi:MAG TPA: amino acid permease [Longimicrobiales bacterium]
MARSADAHYNAVAAKDPSGATGLRREIGFVDATTIVISGIIGGGIFFTPATVAQALPSGFWIILAWCTGAVIAFAGALTFAELGSRFPHAGGHYLYIRDAFGGLPAFLYGWMLLLIIATGALASLALAFAGYVSAFLPMSPMQQRLFGVSTIVVLSIINVLGVKPGTRTTTVLTIFKVAGLAVLIAGGLLVPHTATAAVMLADTNLVQGFAAALVPILFTYGGWQQLNFVAGEVKDAQRVVPRALAAGVVVVALVYVGANLVYLRALQPQGMATATAIAQSAAQVLFGDVASRAITVLIAVSILAFSNVVVMVTPRVFYAMARDRVFLKELAEIHPRFNTPAKAIALQGIWGIVLVMAGSVGALVNGVVFADWIFFGLGAASLFVFRKRSREQPVYQTPGYPIVPAFFVLAALIAVASAVYTYPTESLIGIAMLAAGSVFYHIRKPS